MSTSNDNMTNPVRNYRDEINVRETARDRPCGLTKLHNCTYSDEKTGLPTEVVMEWNKED